MRKKIEEKIDWSLGHRRIHPNLDVAGCNSCKISKAKLYKSRVKKILSILQDLESEA